MDGASPCIARTVGRSTCLAILAFAIVAGCSTYIGTTPKSFLHQIRSNPDPNIRYLAYSKLGSAELYDSPEEKYEAVKVLIVKLSEGKEPLAIRAVIIRTLGELGDHRARDVVARAVADPEAVIRTEACRALGKVGRPEDVTILAGVMAADNLEDCRIAAIEGIGELKSADPRIFHVLIEGMDHEDPAIRLYCYRSLKQITGKDLGSTPEAWRRELEPQTASSDKTANAAADAAKLKTKTR
ncbi:MAG: HEAT repeat domain-containing protein [Isosphaeraceae bacterium]